MRSTPLFLNGRLYHIRYDLNAAWDMECIIKGGLYSILDRPLTLELISDLLWFGLKWDNPDLTVSDTRKILKKMIKDNYSIKNRILSLINKSDTHFVLLQILESCKNEMFISGWISKTQQEKLTNVKSGRDAETPITGIDVIIKYERDAYMSGYQGDPWKLTPAEILDYANARYERVSSDYEHADLNTAVICAVMVNSQRKRDSDPIVSWEDFMPKRAPDKTQTAQDQQNMITQLNALFGGGVE